MVNEIMQALSDIIIAMAVYVAIWVAIFGYKEIHKKC